jgi:hypothetical protein
LVEGSGRRASVYVVEGPVARRVAVEVEAWMGDRAVLRAGRGGGLAEGTRVVVRGAEFVRDGVGIRVLGEGDEGAAGF